MTVDTRSLESQCEKKNMLPSFVSVVQMNLCSNFPSRADGPRLVVDGLRQWARERLEETLQGERDQRRSGHRVVILKEAPLGRSGLSVSKLDKVQDSLGDRICGAHGFGRFESEVNNIDREDAEQVHQEFDL